MHGQIEKYKSNGHFFFMTKNELSVVCNAPKKGLGVFIVYALKDGRIELIYVGAGGKINQNGTVNSQDGGLFESIVNGRQFDEPRHKSWKQKLISEKIEALDVYWYETMDKKHSDIPSAVEGRILQDFYSINEVLPPWNLEF